MTPARIAHSGRATAFQAVGGEFETRFSLKNELGFRMSAGIRSAEQP